MSLIKFNTNREAAREYPAVWNGLDAFDRLLEGAFSPMWPVVGRAVRADAALYSPPVDITHSGDEVVVRAELPGVKSEDIELTIHGDTLTIKGSKRMEQSGEETEGKYRYVERRYGEFVRSFALPTIVDESKTQAAFKDGVLEIRMPVAEAAKPRKIEIKNGK